MNYDNLINETIEKNKLIQIKENIYLTQYQIDILKKYQIPYESCNSINEIIFLIEDLLETEWYLEDLENVSESLGEFDYYNNYKK